tara:strand:+ start:4696 stop:5070 length:375 start_codon:yes stop_codon:yes gene_type:complete
MVLYYKKVKKEVDLEPDDSSEEISKRYNLPTVTTTTHDPVGTRASMNDRLPSNQHLFDEIYKTPFGDRKELYYSLLEDNFNNLSMDDKLVVMYKTSILRSNITNNYILICLAILVIIALNLYSK